MLSVKSISEPMILCIELNNNEFLDSRIVRLQKGWTLRFVCGKKLLGKSVKLEISNSVCYTFKALSSLKNLDNENVFNYVCNDFGAFSYNFYALESKTPNVPVGRGYFSVVPEWKLADSSQILSLNGLSIITHLTKLLGPLSEWRDRLKVAKEAGYNVIHLSPVQKLGISNSSYSIADYHQLNPLIKAEFSQLEAFVNSLEKEWKMLTIQDVVWNHAAKNAEWLWQHPECSFNCANSPHLRPAFVIDRALFHFSQEIAKGKWEYHGLPPTIENDQHLEALKSILETDIFPAIRLHEFYQVNVEKYISEFRTKITQRANPVSNNLLNVDDYSLIIQDPEFHRFGSFVDIDKCLEVFNRPESGADNDYINNYCESFRRFLEGKNAEACSIATSHCNAAIKAIIGHVAYERVLGHGPRRHLVTKDFPLVTNYFLYPPNTESRSWSEDEKMAYADDSACYLMACNGWVMNADPLVNFAEPPSLAYLCRELVCWGDCVKLNYGRKSSDCPYLWDYMKRYTEQCAKIFHGFRIDNCHSTPIHVAEYLLNAARKFRHNLYVVAELFTGDETTDNFFVNRLGITSLIRECQNASDSHEQGRFVYRYSGDAVGSFRSKSVRPAPAGVAHALFYDQTHDNPSPAQKRTVYDYIPTAAMTAMAYCASGTTRGYDELIPYHIDVVKETRLYNGWSNISANPQHLIGIIKARKLFNNLHSELAESGYSEIFVDQVNVDIVAITRHNPITHESVLLISHCCFSEFKWKPNCNDIAVADDITEILFEVKMVEDNNITKENGESESSHLHGLFNYRVEIYENIDLDNSMAIDISPENAIHFKIFTSGSVIAFKIKPKEATTTACTAIENIVKEPTMRNELIAELQNFDLQDFNYLLFSCEAEEKVQYQNEAYNVPNFGKLVYCGLQGIYTVLKRIQENNDLGHPLCSNLREGTWLCDYLLSRLTRTGNLKFVGIAEILRKAFAYLRNGVPHFLRPCYFEMLFSYFYLAIKQVVNERLFYEFVPIPRLAITEKLFLSSISFVASISNARLPPIVEAKCSIAGNNSSPSLSAGLPHFAEGIWRNWGRDTFIALPGVLLLNGRFAEAHDIIIAFAGTLRHGLIPNLLAEGRAARYNCRDAIWFWLVAILRYIELAPNGTEILRSKVLRLYAFDNAEYLAVEKIELLYETMYEAICRHFDGISFRERNAGHKIDEHMTSEGFNINAHIDQTTGFVYGGNAWNCGTWMDKMGSSERSGNRGWPATPRDGAAVELQGLALFVAEGLTRLSLTNQFPYAEIKGKFATLSWSDWANKIRLSFKEKFYVAEDCDDKFVHRKEIIKDCVNSSGGFTDFQLRPNFCITLAAVPDILEPEKAWKALEIAREILGGPLGMKTLDPKDWAYNGTYNNDDDGTNKQTAKGWNYHQGPEWLWLTGVYLNAKLKVAYLWEEKSKNSIIWTTAVEEVMQKLYAYSAYMQSDPWSSLPELTNFNGTPCPHSCLAQAWSIGCFTEALHTLNTILAKKINHGITNPKAN